MESKEGSVKKLIRVHLNARKQSTLQRKYTKLNSKTNMNSQTRTVVFKSPEMLIRLFHKENKQNGRSISIDEPSHLPRVRLTNFITNNCFSQKALLTTIDNNKLSPEKKNQENDKKQQQKIMRIKSQQSINFQSRFQTGRRKTSKCKVMVHNPFDLKTSKSPRKQLFSQSKIFKNESRMSNSGKEDLAQIISLL